MIKLLITALMASHILASTNEQRFVCKTVSNSFNETSTTTRHQTSRGRPGPPGKRGPRGFQGPQGPPGLDGLDGTTNLTAIRLINTTIWEEISQVKRQLQCNDGVIVGRICYKLPYRVGVGVNFHTARSICEFHGWELAEIPTEEVYGVIVEYVKTSWYHTIAGSANVVEVWLGSSYNGDGNIILRNGEIGYVRWYPDYPRWSIINTKVVIVIKLRPGEGFSGMWNASPGTIANLVPLCQFTLE